MRKPTIFLKAKVAAPEGGGTPTPRPPARPLETAVAIMRLASSPPGGWPGWAADPAVHAAHLELLDRATHAPARTPTGSGRGVIVGAGGSLFFGCACVSLRVLRGLGCTLPVQFWHLGRSELDPRMAVLASDLGAECVDALAVAAGLAPAERPRILNGWEMKAFAVEHCPFREVLWLDADCVPARDPTPLFDRPEYAAAGAAFWPDIPPARNREWVPADAWAGVGLAYRHEPDFETGQFLIDKARSSKPLALTRHLNDHSDWYYRMVFGDKTTFHLGWRKAGADYAMPRSAAAWAAPVIKQYGFDGRLSFDHACQGKALLAAGIRIPVLALADKAAEAGAWLRGAWHGRLWDWSDMAAEEAGLAAQACGRYRYVRVGIANAERVMELLQGGLVGGGAAACERRWCLRVLGGEPTLVVTGDAHKGSQVGMMFLTRGEDGVWRGRWEAHERGPVELTSL